MGNGLWFIYWSCSHLVWAIILHMIIIILSCLLIMAIFQGMLARWSRLIWLCKDHSTEVVLALRRGVQHYPNEKQAGEEADLSKVDYAALCSCRSSSRASQDTEGPWQTQHNFFFTCKQSLLQMFHPLMGLYPLLSHLPPRFSLLNMHDCKYSEQSTILPPFTWVFIFR